MKNQSNSGPRRATDILGRFLGIATDSPSQIQVLRLLRALDLTYSEANVCLRTFPIGLTRHLVVFGDPEYISYEWAIVTDGEVIKHSNFGYGCDQIALRDGLIACYGAPANAMACDATLAHTARKAINMLRLDDDAGSAERHSRLALFLAGWKARISTEFPETAAILDTLLFGGPAACSRDTTQNAPASALNTKGLC